MTEGVARQAWPGVRVWPGANGDAAVAALFAAGSQGVQEEEGTFLTHFPPGTDLDAVRNLVVAADPAARFEIGTTDQTDWSEAWKERVRAHALGPLTIAPPWLAAEHDPARTIVIDPGMAFGTGEHATTRGVVRLLPGVLRAGDVVADLGAGSAVLSIAAAKLGAAWVAAIEMDEDAIANAEANVERNGVGARVRVIHGDASTLLPLVAPVRLVLANILSSVLTALLPTIERALAPDGQAILSGVLVTEREAMLGAILAAGFRLEHEDVEEIWWSASIARA